MTGYREVWNSPLLQDIRAHLARGEFHSYCLASPACPIVRKKFEAHELARPSKTAIRAREAVNWVHNKWPRTVWVAQWSTLSLKRVFTEPAYWEKQAARVWRAITRAS